jgi:hypothetical protein
MAGIKTNPLNTTTNTVDEQYLFTLVRVRRCTHTAPLIPEVESFRAQIDAAITEEPSLREADMEASAGVHFVDWDLDGRTLWPGGAGSTGAQEERTLHRTLSLALSAA